MIKLSLFKPTGHLTLGNHLGALRPMVAGQSEGRGFYGIADLHALTVPHEPARLRSLSAEMARLMVAVGLDRSTLFVQSRVPAHSELSFLLESTVLALLGGVLGVIASMAMGTVSFSMVNFATWSEVIFRFEPTPGIVLWAFVFAAVMGIIGGFLPALRAASTSPIQAMRN